jgi:hypothetical protein
MPAVSFLPASAVSLRRLRRPRPGRGVSSMCTGTSSDPRRDDTRATSFSAKPSRAASSGQRLSVSGRRIGVA